jgi:hypothetical protein
MSDPNNKLDFSAISFDDVVGDGAPGLDVAEPLEDSQSVEDPIEEEYDEVDNELDEDVQDYADEEDYGDEDHEDYVDEEYEDDDEERTVEDELGEDASIADQISNTLGFEMEYEYADTVEGLTEYVKDMAQEVAEDQIEDLFRQFPEVQQHLDYVLAGGDSGQFFQAYNPQLDYGNLRVEEGDIGVQKALLAQYFETKGHPEDFIEEMLNDYEDSGKLYGKAQVAQQELAAMQEQQRQYMFEQQQQEYATFQAEQEEFWEGVADVIESGNSFGGVTIPDVEKANFFEYISAPVNEEGQTQRDIDYAESEMDIKLAMDYLLYSGFDLEGIINTKARTQSARNLRERIISNEERVRSAKGAQRRKQKTFDPDQLDINALLG